MTTHDVDAKRAVLTIRHTKSRRDRIVPLPAVTLDALRLWMSQGRRLSESLFPGCSGLETLTRQALHGFLRLATARAGITMRVYAHLLRHSVVSHPLELGASAS